MKTLSQLKQEIQEETSENPEKFFATDILREKGFSRSCCESCGIYFWSVSDREVCGEPECGDGYTFINDSPTEETFTHTESWEAFSEFMESRGYPSIDRYPVVARWREDVEFTGASIFCFQPHIVSGEAEPPADELVIPQPSLRFNDVDNVGITGRHYTNFTMIGQTCFQPPERYDQDRYFRDMVEFTSQKLGIPLEKMVFHEESWGGGGNLGPCMECFVDGLELWNQVYMFYEQKPEGYEELDLQVLDMGMGHERITWISNGTETSYECVMPETLEKMKERVGLEVDRDLWEQFLPYSSELNADEVEDMESKWQEIAENLGEDVEELKDAIKPAAALYSVAEHARALIFALADGKIPSNTGGGHNLRMIFRRAQDFIERYNWNLEMTEAARWNAEELEPVFPELLASMEDIEEILEVEERKYREAREKAQKKLDELETEPSTEKMLELYRSHGVSPEMMEEEGFNVPEDFYMKLGGDKEVVEAEENRFDAEDAPETDLLYYRDQRRRECEAEVVFSTGKWVALDKTVFYPEGGGQEPDTGTIRTGEKELLVEDVQKQGDVVLHHVGENSLEPGNEVRAEIDGERRRQLTQHHSSTHMVNAAAREVLGDHIYQAGAHKTEEKGRLDVTHYESLDRGVLDEIEAEVRETIEKDREIFVKELPRGEAERRHGFRIYQGGTPPGNTVRLIEIQDEDIEACGGTHLVSTGEAGEFYITGSNRIQDGVIRLEYKAGEAAQEHINRIQERVKELEDLLSGRLETDPRLAQRDICERFSVEPEQLIDTVERFRDEISENRERIRKLSDFLDKEVEPEKDEGGTLLEAADRLFRRRKTLEKKVEGLEGKIQEKVREELSGDELKLEVPTENIGLLIQVSRQISGSQNARVTLIGEGGAVSASGNDQDARKPLEDLSDQVQGDESFAKAFDIT